MLLDLHALFDTLVKLPPPEVRQLAQRHGLLMPALRVIPERQRAPRLHACIGEDGLSTPMETRLYHHRKHATGLLVHDNSRIECVDDGVLAMLGLADAAQLVGLPLAELFASADDAQASRQAGDRLILIGERLHIAEHRVRHADGGERLIEAVSQPFAGADGLPRFGVTLRDITRERCDEECWDATGEFALLHDQGVIVWCSLAACLMLGEDAPDTIVGTHVIDWLPAAQHADAATRLTAVRTGLPLLPQLPNLSPCRRDGTPLHLNLSTEAYTWGGKTVRRVIGRRRRSLAQDFAALLAARP